MTTVMDRPATQGGQFLTTEPDPFAACPPWCTKDRDWHHSDGDAVHDGPFVAVATHTQPCHRHDAVPLAGDEVWLALEREDEHGDQGATHIYLAPTSGDPGALHCEEAHLCLDEAEALIDRLRDLVAQARGAKRARDIVVGDTVVLDGVPQVVCITLQDAECCCCPSCPGSDECPGSYAFATGVCVDGDWAKWGGRWSFAPDELIPVAAGGAS